MKGHRHDMSQNFEILMFGLIKYGDHITVLGQFQNVKNKVRSRAQNSLLCQYEALVLQIRTVL